MKHSRHRKQLAATTRAWYRELRADGWSAEDAKRATKESIHLIDAIYMLAFEYGNTVTATIIPGKVF